MNSTLHRSFVSKRTNLQGARAPPVPSLYVGIEIEVDRASRTSAFCVYVHDGFCPVEYVAYRLLESGRIEPLDMVASDAILSHLVGSDGNVLYEDECDGHTRGSSSTSTLHLGPDVGTPTDEINSATAATRNDDDCNRVQVDGIAANRKRRPVRSPPLPSSNLDGSIESCALVAAEANQTLYDHWIRPFEDPLLSWLSDYAYRAPRTKIQVAGIGIIIDGQRLTVERHRIGFSQCMQVPHANLCISLLSRLWFELDILPIVVCTDSKGSLDERACSAVRKAILYINPYLSTNIPRINVGFHHEVEVDGRGAIRFCNLEDYRSTVSNELWRELTDHARLIANRRLVVSFFNSTPVGGGVALMRHSIIRFLSLLGIDAHWYVSKPKPEVFQITKLKFHNVLQGVADPNVHFTDQDRMLYEQWCAANTVRCWEEGPFENSNIIVIDDPQLTGIIPHIHRISRSCKVVFRCHIDVRRDLIETDATEANRVWKYLWSNIRTADGFIWHPIPETVPACIPRDKLRYFPAFFDPLDGLCKPLPETHLDYYLSVFNRILYDRTGKRLMYPRRPYILQLCRFDPSKGIPDIIRAYALLRQRIESIVPYTMLPQLVIAGIGAIDDPQGNAIFEETLALLDDDAYDECSADILPALLPPCDQLLNALLTGCQIYTQLSIREGFEIKVTEALHKTKPVVAYATGGIQLQIKNRHNGYLVPTGDIDGVVDMLTRLVTHHDDIARLQRNIENEPNKEFEVVAQTNQWLKYFIELTDNDHRRENIANRN